MKYLLYQLKIGYIPVMSSLVRLVKYRLDIGLFDFLSQCGLIDI